MRAIPAHTVGAPELFEANLLCICSALTLKNETEDLYSRAWMTRISRWKMSSYNSRHPLKGHSWT